MKTKEETVRNKGMDMSTVGGEGLEREPSGHREIQQERPAQPETQSEQSQKRRPAQSGAQSGREQTRRPAQPETQSGQSQKRRPAQSEAQNGREQTRRPVQPQGMQRQLLQQQRQRMVNKWMAAAIVLTWCVLAVSLFFVVTLYREVSHMEELLKSTVMQLQAQEKDERADEYRQAAEYHAPAEERRGETIQEAQEDYPELWGLEQVNRPIERTKRQVQEELKKLSEDGGILKEIYRNRADYPDRLLEALANNPEMAGFVAGYPDRKNSPDAVLTESERKKSFPLFLQWDPRWGYTEYGDNSIVGISGCGPVCVSMALYYLTGNERITPDVIAEYSMDNGYYVSGVGTAWALLEDVPGNYGIRVEQQKIREENLRQALDDGGVLICSMSAGDFTAAGHFIVIYGYDEEGFFVNDPNCVARSRMQWTWESLKGQIKNVWAYSSGGSVAVYRSEPL